ncbi:hypothetical protein AgCh_033590 [Apium graveolens]
MCGTVHDLLKSKRNVFMVKVHCPEIGVMPYPSKSDVWSLGVMAMELSLELPIVNSLWKESAVTKADKKRADGNRQTESAKAAPTKMGFSGAKELNLREDDDYYEEFDMDELDLNIEKYEELFGVGHNDPQHLFNDDGIDNLFRMESPGGKIPAARMHMLLSLLPEMVVCSSIHMVSDRVLPMVLTKEVLNSYVT